MRPRKCRCASDGAIRGHVGTENAAAVTNRTDVIPGLAALAREGMGEWCGSTDGWRARGPP